MAQSYQTESATLKIPGAYPETKVESQGGGATNTGVIAIIGEADCGPDWTKETHITDNAFGPDELDRVIAKYRSGNIVDAFRNMSAPSNDPDIQGSFNRVIIVKTNDSAKASTTLGSYGTISDVGYGKPGNLVAAEVKTKVAEVVPTTGAFAFLQPLAAIAAKVSVNGVVASLSLTSSDTPATFVTKMGTAVGAAGSVSGGVDDSVVGTDASVSVAVAGNVATFTSDVNWQKNPTVGGTLIVPASSAIAGASDENLGCYIITSVTDTTIVATKVKNGSGAPGDVLVSPAAVTPAVATVDADLVTYTPITVSCASTALDGQGKSIEIYDPITEGNDTLAACTRKVTNGTVSVVSFISTTSAPVLLTSAAERQAEIVISRATDNLLEVIDAGGEIAIKIGYNGTTATCTIDNGEFSTTVTGGTGASIPTIKLADMPTIADLAAYINAQTGYTASVWNGILGSLTSLALDDGTFAICSPTASTPGRIKVDFYKMTKAVNTGSVVVRLTGTGANGTGKGLPAVTSQAFLSGGTKGGSTEAGVQAAIDGLEKVRANFIVPLFSRDASDDILDKLTETTSTYTIDGINAYAKSHVLKMSTIKRRRHRQAFLSKRATFDDCRNASGNLASYRCSMTFEDIIAIGSNGVQQFQPWMGAAIAAALQAAGAYKAIFGKLVNLSGALVFDDSYTWENLSMSETALDSGLLPVTKAEDGGGWEFVSDQTTYGRDNNFVFNSIQAVYAMDTIALYTTQKMERRFKGQSVADVPAAVALSFLEKVLDDVRRNLKLIAPSDDAPLGYKNIRIKIVGPTMLVTFEVKLAGAIYFIPMTILVQPVVSTAAQE